MKQYIIYGTALITAVISAFVWVNYVEPKLSFLSPDKIVNNLANIERVFPVVKIPASKKVTDLPIGKQIPLTELSAGLKDFLKQSKTTNFAVFHKGQMVHESYYQGHNRDSTPMSFSTAKTFVATLVGFAIQDGKIQSINDPVEKYEPKFINSGYAGATIKDLLQMSSGVDYTEEYNDETSDAFHIYNSMYIWFKSIDTVTISFKSKQKPGKEFYYRSIDTHALAMVLEAATGKPIEQYLHEKLWQPLGMNEGKWITDTHGNTIGFWGLNVQARDFAKLGQLYLQNGMWEGKQLLSDEWVKASTQPDPKRDDLQRGKIYGDWGYQNCWWLPKGSNDDFSAIGIWGQFIYVNREHNMVVVKFSADPDFKKHEYKAMEIFRKIGKNLSELDQMKAE